MENADFCRWCEQEVTRRRVGWFGSYANAGGELIHYVDGGAGEPLVLLHGFMGWSYTWRSNFQALSERARVLALDLRGFGLSEKSGSRGHSLNDQVEVVKSFLDTLELDQAVLCGHSMGGEVSLRFALKYPERVKALILVASSGYVQRIERPVERWALRLPGVSRLFVRSVVLNRRFAARTLRAAFRAPDKVRDADVEAYLLPAKAPGSISAFVSMLRDMDFGMTAGQLHEVPHRSLLIWGENDPWLPLEYGQRFARELRRSELVVFPECGHIPHEEHPQEFNSSVIRFLESIEGTCP